MQTTEEVCPHKLQHKLKRKSFRKFGLLIHTEHVHVYIALFLQLVSTGKRRDNLCVLAKLSKIKRNWRYDDVFYVLILRLELSMTVPINNIQHIIGRP
jgi:hypothetical protein